MSFCPFSITNDPSGTVYVCVATLIKFKAMEYLRPVSEILVEFQITKVQNSVSYIIISFCEVYNAYENIMFRQCIIFHVVFHRLGTFD